MSWGVRWIPPFLKIKRKLTIGNISIFNLTPYQKKKMLAEVVSPTSVKKGIKNPLLNMFFKAYQNKPIIHIKVSGNQKQVEEIASYRANLVLNILRLYQSMQEIFDYKTYISLTEGVITSKNKLIFNNDLKKHHSHYSHSFLDTTNPYVINNKKKKIMRNNGFTIICNILKKSNSTNFDNILLSGIYWYGEALNINVEKSIDWDYLVKYQQKDVKDRKLIHISLADQYLKFIIALETMLIFDKREPIDNSISERVAFIVGNNYIARNKIKKDIKALYDLRSSIVHNGLINIPREDHMKLVIYTNAVIINLVKLSAKYGFNEHDDLRRYLEKLKLS